MEKNILAGVKLEFNDLSEETQKRLYLENKEKFKKEVVKSQYTSVRKLLIDDLETDSETLDEVFKVETEIQNILKLFEHPNFQKDLSKIKVLSESNYCELRIIAAKDKESTSELLNQMLRNEIDGDFDRKVKDEIFKNLKFKMDEETRKKLCESKNSYLRELAAKDKGSTSEFLNQMLLNEINGYCDLYVIEEILDNSNFKMEVETRKKLCESKYWELRQLVAKDKESTSELLNQMLRNEIDGNDDLDVREAILNNPNFKMDEETRNKLSESENLHYRMLVARDEGTSKEIIEKMYSKEYNSGILEILETKLCKTTTPTTVTIKQRKNILKVLRNVQSSNNKDNLLQYLEQILEIIG